MPIKAAIDGKYDKQALSTCSKSILAEFLGVDQFFFHVVNEHTNVHLNVLENVLFCASKCFAIMHKASKEF
jgi:hypothetical protein